MVRVIPTAGIPMDDLPDNGADGIALDRVVELPSFQEEVAQASCSPQEATPQVIVSADDLGSDVKEGEL